MRNVPLFHAMVVSFLVLLTPLVTAGTITSAQSGFWTDASVWAGGVVPGPTDSVYVLDGHQITVDAVGSCLWLSILGQLSETGVGLVPGGDLTIGGDAFVYAPTADASAYLDGCNGILTVTGSVTLTGGSSVNQIAKLLVENGETSILGNIVMNNNRSRITFDGDGTLFIGGNLSGAGLLSAGIGTVAFNGTVPQMVGGYTYNNLTIDNMSGAALDGAATVNGILTLHAGVLSIGSVDLTMGTGDSIAGGSATSYVAASGSGRLRRTVSFSAPTGFPVGTASSYNPVSIQGSAGADEFAVGVLESVVPPTGNDDAYVQRTWVISQSAPGSTGAVSLALQWNEVEEGDLFNRAFAACWVHDGISWTEAGAILSISGTDPFVAAFPPLATLGSFAIGNSGTSSADEVGSGLPGTFFLSQNYPNPFNPSTRIHFMVEQPGRAELAVFNVIGQKVATVFTGEVEAKKVYNVDFDAAGLASGLYLYTLKTGTRQETRRMVLMR